MKEVLCLATGKTYELILDTGITAHPTTPPYPKEHTEYLVPIKKGGTLECLYDVIETIDCYPEDIYGYKDMLSAENYSNLCRYHEKRKSTFGYSKKNIKYRFYILKLRALIKNGFTKKGIQVSVRIDLADVI
jgi:hypothetical protein